MLTDATTEAPPIVEMEGVYKAFGEAVVLDGFSLAVQAAEKLAIIGPSGSGKSTILRILMTLEGVDRGAVVVDGIPLFGDGRSDADERAKRVRSRVGMVFQQFNLFPHMSVLDNVTFAPRHVSKVPRAEAETSARELLEQVGLSDKAHEYPARLSGGQRQRVAIARALAMRPKIMLLDEVTSALDPELVGEVLGVLRHLARETRMTMLIVTHEMRFAREVADRVAFIDGGRVVEAGPPSRVLEDPAEARTRRFLERVLEA